MPPPSRWQSRRPIPRPALWIAIPTFVVSLAVAASLKAGIFAALVVALLGAIAVGVFAERRLVRTISSFERIAPEPWSQWLPKNLKRELALKKAV